MTVEVKGTHGYTPGESTKEYVDKKLKRLEAIKEHIENLHIILDKETQDEYKAESNIHFRWGVMSHIAVTDRDLFKAIDSLFDKMMVKIKKEKEKVQVH